MTDTLGRETFRDFCALTFAEVSQRAEAVRAEIEEGRGSGGSPRLIAPTTTRHGCRSSAP
jgi:hypothetical protein